jgi:hypothetical protein
MPTYFKAFDVLNGNLPKQATRKGKTNAPLSRTNCDVLIPEAKYNQTFEATAQKMVKQEQDMGAREQIVRGIRIKEQSFATLQIIEAGEQNPKSGFSFDEFLLQGVQEVSQEKYQLVETFGETVGFFFGTRPKVYQYSGALLNTEDYPWRDNWKEFYETELRGTRLVEEGRRAYLTYDWVLREGYLLSMNMADNAARPNQIDFNFVMFITKEVNLSPAQVSGGRFDALAESLQQEAAAASADQINRAEIVAAQVQANLDRAQEGHVNQLGDLRNFNPGYAVTQMDPEEWIYDGATTAALQIGSEMIDPFAGLAAAGAGP